MGVVNLKIALTGAIGSGKSLVAELFRAQGARVVNADEISRLLLKPAEMGWQALQVEFGPRFFKADQTVDRKKLRAAIFADQFLREKVNSIIHPLIRQAVNEICAEDPDLKAGSPHEGLGVKITVVEVPLLFEVGWQGDFDLVIVVSADDETCLSRVMSRDGVDHQAALAAFATQMSLAEKVSRADHVIDNSGDIGATAQQVEKLYKNLSA